MSGKSTIVVVLSLAVCRNAGAEMTAIKFGKLWDGHSVTKNAVVLVDGDKIVSVSAHGPFPKARRPST